MEYFEQVRDQQDKDPARGLAFLDSETLESLRHRSRRQPSSLTSPARTLALVLVLLLHALFALLMWYAMKPRLLDPAVVAVDDSPALVVRLLDDSVTAPAPPRSLPPPVVISPARPVVREKSRPDAMVLQEHEAAPAPASSVDTPTSVNPASLRIPPAPANTWSNGSKPPPPKPSDDRRIMQHDSNRMHYKATRFEKYFPPPNETAGGALGRHIGDAIKAGIKESCDPKNKDAANNLLCDYPPPPPSPKDRDERLNLPPPSLTGVPPPTTSPPLANCIAEYNDSKPLSDGCPVNTPDLAFKAQMRVCIDLFRAGKRLKTWCPLDTPKRAAAESSTPAASSSAGAGAGAH